MKKTIYFIFNIFLVVAIAGVGLFLPKEKKIFNNIDIKLLTTSELRGEQSFLRRDDSSSKNENNSVNKILDSNLSILENTISDSLVNSSVISDVLETQVGSMSSYGPDCRGCSGRLGGGYDARGGNYYYSDKKYGNVRIVAGDSKYPYGTIVRVVNSKQGSFNAIVLDRGGAIGIGRKFTFDLLCPSQKVAASNGTSYNVKFEILRYGY